MQVNFQKRLNNSFSSMINSKEHKKTFLIVLISITLLTVFAFRLSQLDTAVSYPSICENDSVMPAVGFFDGDLDMHWYKYGPLTAYVLSTIYAISSVIQGESIDTTASKIFFDSDHFYIIARILNLAISILLGLITFRLAKYLFGKRTGYVALIIGLFPIVDLLSDFKLRIDTMLALWILLSVYRLVKLIQERKSKYYIYAGIFWGLALATKPLPAFVLIPCIIFFHVYYLHTAKDTIKKWGKLPDSNIGLLFLSGLVTNIYFNPYSLLNFHAYLSEQISAVLKEGARAYAPGWDITRFSHDFGYLFIISLIVSTIYIIIKIVRERQILLAVMFSYAGLLWILFAPGAARDYFYIPIVPFTIIMLSKTLTDFTEKLSGGKDWILALIMLSGTKVKFYLINIPLPPPLIGAMPILRGIQIY